MSPATAPGTRIVIAGLGGQGVVFATRLISQAAIALGWPVIAAETHGMSQRGGSVLSHIKLGSYPSSLIRRGSAHLLLALDPNEAVRSLPFLAPGGACLINSADGLGPDLSDALRSSQVRMHAFPATRLALESGSAALVNTIIVGCAAGLGWLPLPLEALRACLGELAPGRRQANLDAFEVGVRAAAAEPAREA